MNWTVFGLILLYETCVVTCHCLFTSFRCWIWQFLSVVVALSVLVWISQTEPVAWGLVLFSTLFLSLSLSVIDNPWFFEKKVLWTDLWHVLSFLSHWPLSAYLTVTYVEPLWWVPLALLTWSSWQIVKKLFGKRWPTIWEIIYRWARG